MKFGAVRPASIPHPRRAQMLSRSLPLFVRAGRFPFQDALLARASSPRSGACGLARLLRDSMWLVAVSMSLLGPASGQCADHGQCEPLRERVDRPILDGARQFVRPPISGFDLSASRLEDVPVRGQHVADFAGDITSGSYSSNTLPVVGLALAEVTPLISARWRCVSSLARAFPLSRADRRRRRPER